MRKVSWYPDRPPAHYSLFLFHSSPVQIRKGRVGATLPLEPWNQTEHPDPVLEESWLSSLDDPHPSERPSSPHDRVRVADNVVIYSGGFNDSSENVVSSANSPVQQEMDYRIPTSLSRHPSDPSLSAWDDSLSSLSSFTAESESDFQTSASPTWSSFSRRSSGEGNTSTIFDGPLPPFSLVGAIDALSSGTDLSRSNSNSSVSLSDEDLASPPPFNDSQIPTPPALPVPVDFHPGTSAETIRPSPSQLMELRLSERLSSESLFSQRSRSSRSSSVTSSPGSGPVTPDPSECSYLSMEESDDGSDEDGIPYDQDVEFEDEQVENIGDGNQDVSEVETVYDRHSLLMGGSRGSDVKCGSSSTSSEEPQDGEGSSSSNYGGGRYTDASQDRHGYGSLGGRSPGTRKSSGGASGSGGGRDGDGRRPSQPSNPLCGTEEDEDADSTDEHSEDEPSSNLHGPSALLRKRSSDEDDVPLARSIPTALKAQKTIRKKVREENAQRRQERAMRMQAKMLNVSGVPRSAEPAVTALQHDQVSPQFPTRTTGKSRTQKLPPTVATHRSPIAVDDLTKRLMSVKASMTGSNNQELHRSGTKSSHQHTQEPGPSSKSRRSSQEMSYPLPPPPPNPIHETFQKPTLRPMRSFHRPTKALQPDTHGPLPSPGSGDPGITPSRSIRRPRTGDPTTNQPSTSAFPNFSLQRSRSTKQQNQARLQDDDYGSPGRSSVNRPSAEASVDSRAHWSEKAAALPPVPPIPTYDMLMRQKSGETWQQKVFLGDMQRSTVVEAGATTSAQDVIDAIESRGEMGTNDPHDNGGKGWMLFELAQDFGMGVFSPLNVAIHQLNVSIRRTANPVLRSPFRHQSLLE